MALTKYIRPEVFPTPFCQGCGHGILMQAILRAIDELKLDVDDTVFVSGIGCAAWIPSPHFAADTLHTTHGRAVAFATGVKLYNPKLKVIVVSGDGDISAIGGNHLIHAARRNLDITVICANNSIYGMTGGQVAPTTPKGSKTVTTPLGSNEPSFDLCKLVWGAGPVRSDQYPKSKQKNAKLSSSANTSNGAGAIYNARSTVYHARELVKYIKNGLNHKGFSFIDVISPCYTQFGRRNQIVCGAGAPEMILNLKKSAIRAKSPGDLFTFNKKDRILIGEFNK